MNINYQTSNRQEMELNIKKAELEARKYSSAERPEVYRNLRNAQSNLAEHNHISRMYNRK